METERSCGRPTCRRAWAMYEGRDGLGIEGITGTITRELYAVWFGLVFKVFLFLKKLKVKLNGTVFSFF
jgi:hypothetical protein